MAKDTSILIQKTAISLFKKDGFSKVTIDEICQSAGVTKSTFYYHFPSKDHLLYNFLNLSKTISPDATRILATSDNYWEKLWVCLEPALDWIIDAGMEIFSQILIQSIGNHQNFLSMVDDPEVSSLLIGIIEKGQETGQFAKQGTSAAIYTNLINIVVGTALLWCITSGETRFKDSVKDSLASMLEVRDDLFYI